MTKSSNVEVIVDRMIDYMISINDNHYKTEIASRCVELAEQFAPSNHWFIQVIIMLAVLLIIYFTILVLNHLSICLMLAMPDVFTPQTMNKVFEHAGDLVNIKVAHNLMRLIAEGFGEDDDNADSQLRSSAVCYFYDFAWLHTQSHMFIHSFFVCFIKLLMLIRSRHGSFDIW